MILTSRQAGTPAAPEPPVPGGAVRVAALQMASGPQVEANLREAERLVAIAAGAGAQVVALPEYFCLMGMKDTDKVALREREGAGPIQDRLRAMAQRHGVWVVGGTLPLACDDPAKVRNTCLVWNAQGERVARYDKIHLFSFEQGEERYSEERTIEPGDRVVTFATPWGRMGLSICYDLRFPELYRAMGEVSVIFIPSAFTETTGRAHWSTLVRARAIENLCFVVAPAQGGYHVNGRETHGHSMIVDPWGTVLDELPRGSGVVIADLDANLRARVRSNLPALRHRTLPPLTP